MYDFDEVVRSIISYVPSPQFIFATVCAADAEKRLLKVILEPYGIETGWCKICKGTFTDKIGAVVLVAELGNVCSQYIVMHNFSNANDDGMNENDTPGAGNSGETGDTDDNGNDNNNGNAGYYTVETMEVAPYIENGYSLLPLRIIGERILGLTADKITWDPINKIARFN